MSEKSIERTANNDPRVIASRERLREIPRWRIVSVYKAQRAHIDLLFRVQNELRRARN